MNYGWARSATALAMVALLAGPLAACDRAPAAPDEVSLDLDANEKDLIVRALRETRGNRSAAAKVLGISRRTLHRKLHVYGLEDC